MQLASGTSGYSSSSSSSSPLAISKSASTKDGTCVETVEEFCSTNVCPSSKNEELSGSSEAIPAIGVNPDLERFSLELNNFNSTKITLKNL